MLGLQGSSPGVVVREFCKGKLLKEIGVRANSEGAVACSQNPDLLVKTGTVVRL